jgi:hypothetical protein
MLFSALYISLFLDMWIVITLIRDLSACLIYSNFVHTFSPTLNCHPVGCFMIRPYLFFLIFHIGIASRIFQAVLPV